MLLATASHAEFDRSSSGRISTWLRTPTRPFSRRQPWKLRLPRGLLRLPLVLLVMAVASPALGLEVLGVDVLADARVGDHLADVLAVLDDGVALLQRLERHLVADRDVLPGLEPHRLVDL